MLTRCAVFLAIAIGVLLPRTAEACSCVMPGPPCQDYWRVAAVFHGRVESIARTSSKAAPGLPGQRVVSLSVLEGFSGATGDRIQVRTGLGGGDCGYTFREGVEYIVYAHRSDDGQLNVSMCSRTRPVSEAAADLDYARSLAAGGGAPSKIAGDVTVGLRDLTRQSNKPPRPLAGASVVIAREDGISTRTETGADGRFSVEGLAPGRYTAAVDAGDRFYAQVSPVHLDLPDPRACTILSAVVYDDGRVRGRMVDAGGRPVPGLTIELTVPVGLDSPLGPERIRTVTRGDGQFELARVPAGNFVVGINTQRGREGALPDPRVFYPGVPTLTGARRIAVAAGERVDLADFVLPASVKYVAISGLVTDAGGVPTAAARVYLKGPAEADYILSEPVETDGSGRFVVAAIEGRDYRVFAERPRDDSAAGRIDSSEQVTFTSAADLRPIKLTLRRRY